MIKIDGIKYILASQSPRRRELFKEISADFEICVSSVDENKFIAPFPEELAMKIAEAKAEDILTNKKDSVDKIIVAADTIVVLDGKIYGKPVDRKEARKMIGELNGKFHNVITGYCLMCADAEIKICDFDISQVKIKTMSDIEIDEYAEHSDCLDKAGAYAIQDMRSFSNTKNSNVRQFDIVESYTGSYFNIVGLPLEKLKKELKKIMN